MNIDKIPFAKPYLPDIKGLMKEIEVKLLEVNEAGRRISNGERVSELEDKVAKLSGADHAVACSSCTQGLMIALGAAGVKGTCYTQSFTWDSTAIAANLQGSPVRFREIDRERWTVLAYDVGMSNPDDRGYTLAVDTFGMEFQPVSYLPIFYDRAHSLGVKFRTLGVASVVSLSPSKIITGGEGGIILTNKEKYVQSMRDARDLMSRMSEVNATIALHGLRSLPTLLEWKKETFEMYKKAFPECQFQTGQGNHQVIGMLFDTQEHRDNVHNSLVDAVEFKRYYKPLHLRNPQSPGMPVTEEIYSRILCLPSWYGLNRKYLIDRMRAVMEK
jgi:dTDP-4-amino-4,6-dideoxygalactose transaminase